MVTEGRLPPGPGQPGMERSCQSLEGGWTFSPGTRVSHGPNSRWPFLHPPWRTQLPVFWGSVCPFPINSEEVSNFWNTPPGAAPALGTFCLHLPPRSLHLPGGSGYTATWKGQHSFSECFTQDLCVRGRTWPVDFLPGHKLKLLVIGHLRREAHACYFSFESAVGSSPTVLCCGCRCCFLFFCFFGRVERTDNEAETQRELVTCLKSHSWKIKS